MAVPTSNVNTITDSFQNWIDKTNVLLDAYSTKIVTVAANSSGDVTTGNGTVNGNFAANTLVAVNGLRGGTVTTSGLLSISSNVSIGNSTVNTVINTTTLDTDLALNVLGATALASTLDVTGVTTLTGNAVLNGSLQTFAGNSNFDSGTFFVDSVNNRVGIGNTAPGVALRVTGATDISSSANIQGSANVGGSLGVVGAITGSNTLAITGAATLSNTLSATGTASLASNSLYVTSSAVVVNVATSFANTISIGNSTVNTVVNSTTIDTDLSLAVLGTTTLSNTLSVAGNTTLTSNATLSGALQIISGNSNFDSGVLFVDATNNRVGINNTAPGVALRVTGATDISTTANVQGNANVGGTLGVVGSITGSNTFTVTGNATFSNVMNTTGSVYLASNTVSITSSAIALKANTTLSGNVIISSNTLVVNAVSFIVNAIGDLGSNTTAANLVFSFDKATYKGARMTINMTKLNTSQVSDLILTHDSSSADTTIFGTVKSPTATPDLGIMSTAVVAGNVEIYIRQTGINTGVKVIATLF